MAKIKAETLRVAELIERDAWLDMMAAASASIGTALRLRHASVRGVGLLAASGVPITELNRAMALGQEFTTTATEIDAAIAWLEEFAAPGWRIQVAPQLLSAELRGLLSARSLEPIGNGNAKFVYVGEVPETPVNEVASISSRPDVEVLRAGADLADTFGRLAQTGFGLPDACAEWFAALSDRANWRCYLALLDGEPVGTGAAFQSSTAVWFGIATTAPAARGRGVQSALIGARLDDAHRGRAKVITVETARADVPTGPDFISYRNIRRSGFEEVYARQNFGRPEAS